MKKWLKTSAIALALVALFLVLTFPYGRLSPLLQRGIEKALGQVGLQVQCSITSLGFQLPFGLSWEKLVCMQGSKAAFSWHNGSLVLLPGYQKLSTGVGQGQMSLTANTGFWSPPSHLDANFSNVPIDLSAISKIMLTQSARRGGGIGHQQLFMMLNELKIDGQVTGSLDFPLQQLHRKSGTINLDLKGLKLPEQAALSQYFGLKTVAFSKSVIKAELKSGKLTIGDLEMVSPEIAFKAEGGFEFQEDLPKSVGPLTLKWKLTKSDALLSSPLGSLQANNCPNEDAKGFCNLRYQRLQELI